MHSVIQSYIDDDLYAGAITLIARNGRIVDLHTYGYSCIESNKKMPVDGIFRIYSMSKTITTVCVMQLYEQGKLDLNDSVTKFIPEMKQMKVFVGGNSEHPVFEAPEHDITIRELLTHTSGLPYPFAAGRAEAFYEGNDCLSQPDCNGFIDSLVTCPLLFQPGTDFCYGLSVDVLGVVIERITGKRLGEYMRDNLFMPLGMVDTFFSVPENKRSRLVGLYTGRGPGLERFVHSWDSHSPQIDPNAIGEPICGFDSGGCGLYSTIYDYCIFAQMLLNKGEYNGKQILSPRTVELMTVNQLGDIGDGTHRFSNYKGFGLGFEIRIKFAEGALLGSLGEYGWSGAASTYFRIDPVQNAIEMIFLQHFPYNSHQIFEKFHVLHYQSMVK